MVEDITTSALRKSKRKNNGEEDPVVVIQRLLNLFRQLHVMNDEQKKAFHELILKQPPEIRHTCAVLPGGSLLQEYIDELEESSGIAEDLGSNDDFAQNNILATAMEQNAPQTATAPTVQVVDSGINREMQKQMTLIMQELQETKKDLAKVNQQAQAAALAQVAAQNTSTGSQAPVQPLMPTLSGPATLTADENFAKEIASAVTNAFNMAEESRKKETRELAQTITESQKEISRETQEMTKSLAESQMQMTQKLFSELVQRPVVQSESTPYTPAPTASSAPADANNGGTNTVYVQSADTKEITRAITESQLEMAKMFLQHNAISANAQNNTANNIQINNAPVAGINTEEIISGIIKAQSKLFQEMSLTQTKELTTVIASALKESQQVSTKSMIEALRETQNSSTKTMVETLKAFQKENLKFFEKQARLMPKQTIVQTVAPTISSFADSEMSSPSVEEKLSNDEESGGKTSYIKSVLTKNFSKLMRRSGDETIITETDDFETLMQEPETSEILSEEIPPQEETLIPESSTREELLVEEIESAPQEQEATPIAETETVISLAEEENFEQNNFDGPVKKKRKKKKKKKQNNDVFSLLESNPESSQETFTENNSQEEENQRYGLDASLFDFDTPTTDKNAVLDMSLFDDNDAKQDISFEETTSFDDDFVNIQPVESLSETVIDFQEENSDVEEIQNQEILLSDDDISEDIVQAESEPEQETETKRSSFIPDTTNTDDLYSLYKDMALISEQEEPINLDNENSTVDQSAEKEGEWTWEYEDGDSSAEANVAVADDNSDGEWEWEYEEVDETSDTETIQAADTSTDENSNGEWEWEYEEVDETSDTATVQAADTSTDENGNGEWEWEYEEVDETSSGEENFLKSRDELATMFEEDNLPNIEHKITDPYNTEDKTSETDLGFSSLQSGSLYFQQDVETPIDTAPMPLVNEISEDAEIIIPESGTEESISDPYATNSGIK